MWVLLLTKVCSFRIYGERIGLTLWIGRGRENPRSPRRTCTIIFRGSDK